MNIEDNDKLYDGKLYIKKIEKLILNLIKNINNLESITNIEEINQNLTDIVVAHNNVLDNFYDDNYDDNLKKFFKNSDKFSEKSILYNNNNYITEDN